MQATKLQDNNGGEGLEVCWEVSSHLKDEPHRLGDLNFDTQQAYCFKFRPTDCLLGGQIPMIVIKKTNTKTRHAERFRFCLPRVC